MLKIGQFSKISGLPIKTLRFYDQIGLLAPAHVDEQTGYRYYSEDQLLTVKRIHSFKEQGFTLEQMKAFLHEISLHETLERLNKKQLELQRTIAEAEKQLDELTTRIQRIERTTQGVAPNSMLIRNLKPQLAATIRDCIPRSQLCLLIDEIITYSQDLTTIDVFPNQHSLKNNDTSLRTISNRMNMITIIGHNDSSDENVPVDVEVAIPITTPIPENERVQVKRLPGIKAATFIHNCDPHANRCNAIDTLTTWIKQEKLTIAAQPIREIYLTSDSDIYGRSRLAELQIPVA